MKRTGLALLAAIGLAGTLTPASAAPPTVMPSPGYDARLREQQVAQQKSVAPVTQPVKKRRSKAPAN